MDRFEAMQVFCQVVESGSFVAAADKMTLSTSAVSRLVTQLEMHLQARLLNRTTRRISLTDDGRAYYERCLQLLADLAETEETVSSATKVLRGNLRLTAPVSLGVWQLAPVIAEFSRLHPQIRFDVSLSDQQVDLVEEGLDLAIRVGKLGTQNLVARPLAQAQILVCASPAYLARHGTPQHPDELCQHACLRYGQTEWLFRMRDGTQHSVAVPTTASGNNGLFLRELAVAGVGITMAPDFMLADSLKTGQLQTILQDYPSPTLTIYAAYSSRKHLSAKVRGFVDFLKNWLADGKHVGQGYSEPPGVPQ